MPRLTCALLIIFTSSAVGYACCMLPRTYKGTISQKAQEAVIIHADGRQEMVLRINYQISGKTMPGQFAWVITVPNEPDKYQLADRELFPQMFKLSEHLRPRPRSSKGSKFEQDGDSDSKNGVELGQRAVVGPYDIQPVRGVGKNAIDGLNRWLAKNGFPREDENHMAYFVKRNFTFLAIKISSSKKDRPVASAGLLPPLHLSFASEKPYYPARFSSRQGVFDINLHIFTQKPLDYDENKSMLKRLNFDNQNFRRNAKLPWKNFPAKLQTVFHKSKFRAKRKTWIYNNIRGRAVNRNNAIAKWKTDIFFNGIPKSRAALSLQKPTEPNNISNVLARQ